ncbi:MAG: hypothetical protein ACM3RX_00975 [Methanococcaceae archaeon]
MNVFIKYSGKKKMGLMPMIFTAITIFASAVFILILVSYISYKIKPNKNLPYSKVQQPALQVAAPYLVQKNFIAESPVYSIPTPRPQAPEQRHISYVPVRNVPRFQVMQSENQAAYINFNQAKTINFPRYTESKGQADYNIFHNYSNDNFSGNVRAQRY